LILIEEIEVVLQFFCAWVDPNANQCLMQLISVKWAILVFIDWIKELLDFIIKWVDQFTLFQLQIKIIFYITNFLCVRHKC
jgi:hypothetical protein